MIKMLMLGYLGRDAALRQTDAGSSVINFSCCHTESWTDSRGERQERATWVDCSYWTEKHGILPYLKKGTMVYLEGIPAARHYDAADGTTRSTLTLRVLNVTLAGKSAGENSGDDSSEDEDVPDATATKQAKASTATKTSTATANTATKSKKPAQQVPDPEDDLPF
jgi:single-strand DNA-binding protein